MVFILQVNHCLSVSDYTVHISSKCRATDCWESTLWGDDGDSLMGGRELDGAVANDVDVELSFGRHVNGVRFMLNNTEGEKGIEGERHPIRMTWLEE